MRTKTQDEPLPVELSKGLSGSNPNRCTEYPYNTILMS